MTQTHFPTAVTAAETAIASKPDHLDSHVASRIGLGDLFGLKDFGLNYTRIPPGAISALRHTHSLQDEFVFVLAGHPVLVTDAGETPLAPGMCAGFRAGSDDAHQLINRSAEDVICIEVGARTPGDQVRYPWDSEETVKRALGRG